MQTLSIPDAAAELGLNTWQMNRLLCNQTIRPNNTGISRDDLTQLADGADIDGPELFQDWLDSRAEKFRGDKFIHGVKKLMQSRIPDECPKGDQFFKYSHDFYQLGAAKPAPMLVTKAELPYRSLAECYAVAELRRRALRVLNRLPIGRVKPGTRRETSGKLGQLYETPEQFRRIADAAWTSFQEGSINVRRRYVLQESKPGGPGRSAERTFHLYNSSILGLNKARLIQLAF